MLFSVSGADFHCRWFFVNKAKALAPIAVALSGAFSTPPEEETCAPIRLLLILFSICCLFFKKMLAVNDYDLCVMMSNTNLSVASMPFVPIEVRL